MIFSILGSAESTEALLKKTVFLSLYIQVAAAVSNIISLILVRDKKLQLLRELVIIELVVQVIEAIFYAWLAYNIANVKNITPKRYYDWMVTTPTMLFTLIAYLIYLKYKKENRDTSRLSSWKILVKERETLLWVVLLNFFMLMFGLAGEFKLMSTNFSVFAGFIAFVCYFYLIYKNYVGCVPFEGKSLFFLFTSLWALYGIAALLSYNWKNIWYNLLDLVSKNFFGVYLTYALIKEHYFR